MDICLHSAGCGGCTFQGKYYSEQLKIKEAELLDLLEKNNVKPLEYLGINPAPDVYGYRNKMEYTFGNEIKDGPLTLGMHKKRHFMSIVTVDNCQIVPEDFNIILSAVLDFAKMEKLSFYNKKNHKGFLRNLVVRKGINTGELLINIVTSTQMDLDREKFVDILMRLELEGNIVGILHTYNDGLADAVNCDRLDILYGRDYYVEKISNLDFKVSAFSFFQTNVKAVDILYNRAVAMLDDIEGKSIFDLYCGTGTISQIVAQKAKKVTGIEIVREAVDSATENAKLNGIHNCKFICGDVFEVLDSMREVPEVLIVDPPRAGITPKAMDKLISYGVNQILYISCNPKTLAPNLRYFEYYGYKVEKIEGYDNFPMTKHLEVITLLSKLDSKRHISV